MSRAMEAQGGDSSGSASTQSTPETSDDVRCGKLPRRNLTASADLHKIVPDEGAAATEAPATGMRRNMSSASALSDVRRREQQQLQAAGPVSGSRELVIEAVAHQLLVYIKGPNDALREMRAGLAPTPAPNEDGSPSAPTPISRSMQTYIATIVRQLELPNTCIVAALTYIDRSVKDGRFALSLQNWQPCLLAAFVVAAKLAFDEPVWNEDFVKALRISNVQVTQISKWEADFLQLIGYQTNVGLSTYAALCFQLQQRHEILHDSHAHFFTYLMAQPRAESPAPS